MSGFGWSKGIIRRMRGDGSLARALILALALQLAAPLLGIIPGFAATPAGDSITICTAHGIVTMVPDGQGGWVQQSEPDAAGLSCAFCLPLLSGYVGPVAAPLLPLPPVPERVADPSFVLTTPVAVTPPGSFSPRAPPLR